MSLIHKKIRIVEVGPRDGLQNEKVPIPLQDKINFVSNLFSSGVNELELTSFVRSDKVPQLADAKELTQEISKLGYLDKCWVLIPNIKGLEIALNLGIKNFAFFTSASEAFNQKNINCSVKDSMDRIHTSLKLISDLRYKKRGYLSMVFGCPYEGNVPFSKSVKLIQELFQLGIDEVSLGDTIGNAYPDSVHECIQLVSKASALDKVTMHFHDTKGLAVVNIYESIKLGISSFDTSAAGLGGCPYAIGATGNVATEDVLYLCDKMGLYTGIILPEFVKASQGILKILGKQSLSKIHQFLLKA